MSSEASPPSVSRPLALLLNLALAIVALGVTLYAVEGVLALIGRQRPAGNCPSLQIETDKCEAAHAAGIAFDGRSRVELMQALEARGDSVWPNFNSWELNLRGDTILLGGRPVQPLGGIALVRTLYCNERGTYELYTSDEFGFRNPPGLQVAPVELALIGDSFVQGYCVPSDSTAAALLRAEFPRTVNLGRDNHGPLSQLAVLREYATRLQPGTVLWFFYEGNDLADLEVEKQREPLTRYMDPAYSSHLADYPDSLDRQLRDVVVAKRSVAEERRLRRQNRPSSDGAYGVGSFLTLTGIRQLVARAIQRPSAAHPFDDSLYQRVFQQARKETIAWGGRFVLVYLPAWERFGEPALANPHRDRILAIARKLDVPVVDLAPVFAASADPLGLFPFRLSGHYQPEGQRIMATEIRRFMATSPGAVGPTRE